MPEIFLDRVDAGRQLSDRLRDRLPPDAVVVAVPRGGVPVAVEVALRLRLRLDIVVPRKLAIPWNPDAGFGAVTGDGVIVLSDAIVAELGLTEKQVESIACEVRAEIERRERIYRRDIPRIDLIGKPAVIVDDGLASGYTMLGAVQAVRQRGAARIIVAVPVASQSALRLVIGAADDVVSLVESQRLPFSVADYYVARHDLTDEEVIEQLARATGHLQQPNIAETRGETDA